MSDGISETSPVGEPHPTEEPGIEAPAGVYYGISIFELENREIVVHVTGDPDIGQLQRLLAGALANLNADITARKVIQAMEARDRAKTIVRPGQIFKPKV
jgi:hypothetical protein